LVSINQQVARRRRAARREADTRLAERLGGTWTLLAQVLTAASPPRTRPTGTTSHEAAPTADDTLSHHPTTLELTPTPRDFASRRLIEIEAPRRQLIELPEAL
jgi:hypothetical protein